MSRGRPFSSWRHRRLTIAGVYAAITALTAVVAYLAIFTYYLRFDDEGYLLATLRAFVGGERLYDEIFTQYGPFYYEVFGGFFEVTGRPVTMDSGRLIVVCLWVVTSLGAGLAAHAMSGRTWLGVATQLATFTSLLGLRNEPMHPASLVALLLAAIVLAALAPRPRRLDRRLALVGALGAALALVKINAGGFVLIAAVLACVLVLPAARRRRLALLAPAIALAVTTPLLLMSADLAEGWVQTYATAVTASIVAVVAAAGTRWTPEVDDPVGLRPLWALAAGAAVATAVVLAGIAAIGVSLRQAFETVVVEAAETRDAFTLPFNLDASAVTWALAGVGGAVVVRRVAHLSAGPTALGGILRVLAGVAILLAVTKLPTLVVGTETARFGVPLALAWVAALPSRDGREPATAESLGRVLVVAVAVVQSLHAYPVAGTQVEVAFFLFALVGAMCVADGLRELEAAGAAAREPARRELAATLGTALAIVIVGASLFNFALRPLSDNARTYRHHVSLPFPTASRLQLPRETTALYTTIVNELRPRCGALVTQPGMNSFHEWSGIPELTPLIPNWMFILDDAEQQRIVEKLQGRPQPCVLFNGEVLDLWRRGRELPDRPLLRYIQANFTTARDLGGGYQLMLPRQPPPPPARREGPGAP